MVAEQSVLIRVIRGLLFLSVVVAMPTPAQDRSVGWPVYGGDPGGMRWSALTDINRDNVARLVPPLQSP